MPNILAFESAYDTCSVALSLNSHIAEKSSTEPKQHNALILPMVDTLLRETNIEISEIDAFAFSCGPGSFTGLRIAASVVQGLAFSTDKPVIPISSLGALAQSSYRKLGITEVITISDAKMGEVYWAHYKLNETKQMTAQGDELLCSPSTLPIFSEERIAEKRGALVVGDGHIYQSEVMTRNPLLVDWEKDITASAKDVLQLAMFAYDLGQLYEAEFAIPVYLREEVNWKKLPGR